MLPHTVVVGSGPNGLSAAITLAMAGKQVTVFESNPTIGGGARSSELTLPGFVHDICSAVHPMGCASPFFLKLPLSRYGLHWIHPEAPLAHPLDDGSAVMLERSIEATCRGLGSDSGVYYHLMRPLVHRWNELASMTMQPILRLPHSPFLLARFGILALMPASLLVSIFFKQRRARALFAGEAAHSIRETDAQA
jgi:phytoene dehydrogenase-like protein